jgi:hypothetical protein
MRWLDGHDGKHRDGQDNQQHSAGASRPGTSGH